MTRDTGSIPQRAEIYRLLIAVMSIGVPATLASFEFRDISRTQGKQFLKVIENKLRTLHYDPQIGIPVTVRILPLVRWPKWVLLILNEAVRRNYHELVFLETEEGAHLLKHQEI